MKSKTEILRMTMLAMLIAIGVVISPILRIEGMCPMAHLINIACSVFMGPWYSLLCATLIGIIRMSFMGIPPLALTGAVFGAFLSGVFYRASKGKLICAVLGEVIGTGIIGSIISYPIMAFCISVAQNTIFAPVFMTLHKITDTHILSHGGTLSGFFTPIKMGEIMANLNWRVQWNFVFKKTIPFFWFPAHTITFLLPGDMRVLFAALLGVVLGVLLAIATHKK